MVAVDLSTALQGRVAGQTVDILRIANQNVWDVSAGVPDTWTEHNVFGAAPPVTLTPHADLGVNGWTGSNFALPVDQSGEWELVGGRIYIPGNMGDGISFPFQVSMGYYIRNGLLTDDVTNTIPIINGWGATASPAQTVSSMGWFEYRLPTPQPIFENGAVAVGWQISDGRFYVHSPGTAIDAIAGFGNYTPATDGSAVALEYNSGTHHRGEFGSYDPNAHTETDSGWAFQGAWYGADIILRKKN
jgi:hypothetical protein